MPALITVDELLALPPQGLDATAARAARHLVLNDRLTLDFANRPILLAELQRIMHTEGMTDREALQAECDVYNTLLPVHGLAATLSVTPSATPALAGLDKHLTLQLGKQARLAHWDAPLMPQQQITWPLSAEDRLALADAALPLAIHVDLPNCAVRIPIVGALRRALQEDLT